MTSNTTPSGVCSASTEPTTGKAYMAFDNNSATMWYAGSGLTLPQYVQYAFPSKVKIYGVDITPYYSNQAFLKDFTITNEDNTTLLSETMPNSNAKQSYLFTTVEDSSTYRLNGLNNYANNSDIEVSEILLLGRADV